MLHVRLEGCGTSNEIGTVPSLRIEANSLQVPEQGEVARYENGYWRHADGDFITVVVDNRCQVHFEDQAHRSEPCGPFERVRSSGGSLWASDPQRQHLIARYEGGSAWRSMLDPRRPWPAVVVSPLGEAP
jgi:hypothetical protein